MAQAHEESSTQKTSLLDRGVSWLKYYIELIYSMWDS